MIYEFSIRKRREKYVLFKVVERIIDKVYEVFGIWEILNKYRLGVVVGVDMKVDCRVFKFY